MAPSSGIAAILWGADRNISSSTVTDDCFSISRLSTLRSSLTDQNVHGRFPISFADIAPGLPPPSVDEIDADTANRVYNMKSDNLPVLHGLTDKHDTCRCLPGTLELSLSMQDLHAERDSAIIKASSGAFANYQSEVRQLDKQFGPVLEDLEKEQRAHDALLVSLGEKVKDLDETTTSLADAYKQVKSAYVDNGCRAAATANEAHKEVEPTCSQQYKEVKLQYKKLGMSAHPTCQAGAVDLAALKNASFAVTPLATVAGEAVLQLSRGVCVGTVAFTGSSDASQIHSGSLFSSISRRRRLLRRRSLESWSAYGSFL
eukprot:TRINITY_DN44996_c0_g1_i1.p1 TRINITY_DN44996_c0_g1~~TRINITY_DN44996_c0_g1_i1.p1  ORF type:complete len:316 (+),score=47.21 TRINITY_DN44996_c0_g1_i1:229-1176(+)